MTTTTLVEHRDINEFDDPMTGEIDRDHHRIIQSQPPLQHLDSTMTPAGYVTIDELLNAASHLSMSSMATETDTSRKYFNMSEKIVGSRPTFNLHGQQTGSSGGVVQDQLLHRSTSQLSRTPSELPTLPEQDRVQSPNIIESSEGKHHTHSPNHRNSSRGKQYQGQEQPPTEDSEQQRSRIRSWIRPIHIPHYQSREERYGMHKLPSVNSFSLSNSEPSIGGEVPVPGQQTVDYSSGGSNSDLNGSSGKSQKSNNTKGRILPKPFAPLAGITSRSTSQKTVVSPLAMSSNPKYNPHLIIINQEEKQLEESFTCGIIFRSKRSLELMREYTEFSVEQRSIIVVIICAIFLTCSFFVACAVPIFLKSTMKQYHEIFTLATLASIMNFIDSICCWLLVYRQTNNCKTSTTWFSNVICKHTTLIQSLLILTTTLGYCFRLLSRVVSGTCNVNEVGFYSQMGYLVKEWGCNEYAIVNTLPVDTTFAMIVTPIVAPSVFRESRMDIVILATTITSISMLIATYILGSTDPLYYVIPFFMIGTFVAIDQTRQNMSSFISQKRLKETLEANQKMAAQTEIEMRHVLGNVAHDFKTVSLPYYCHILCLN